MTETADRCPQCGNAYYIRACGPTHALISHERWPWLIDLINREGRNAWQKGSVHGASHLANLQHANPYREQVQP